MKPMSKSKMEIKILEVLKDGKPRMGLDILRESGGGIVNGVMYVALYQMEQDKLVESHEEHLPEDAKRAGRRRYRYRITDEGLKFLKSESGA